MAFTRFHDDEARIIKQLQQQTDQERWYLDVPGSGDKPCFMLDPQIIPQKWSIRISIKLSHKRSIRISATLTNTNKYNCTVYSSKKGPNL